MSIDIAGARRLRARLRAQVNASRHRLMRLSETGGVLTDAEVDALRDLAARLRDVERVIAAAGRRPEVLPRIERKPPLD